MYNVYLFVFTGIFTIPINKTNMSTKCKDCCSEQQVNKITLRPVNSVTTNRNF